MVKASRCNRSSLVNQAIEFKSGVSTLQLEEQFLNLFTCLATNLGKKICLFDSNFGTFLFSSARVHKCLCERVNESERRKCGNFRCANE